MIFKTTIDKPALAEVRDSEVQGRGVFATKDISRSTLIEAAPAVFLSAEEKELLKHSALFNYYFLINSKETPAVFGFGYSSFYNHSYKANCFYTFSPKKKIIRFYAFKKIKKGEEITINYNGQPGDSKQVYFPEND